MREKKEDTKGKKLEETDGKIYETPDLPTKLELEDGLANVLGPEAEDNLKDEFVSSKVLDKTKDSFMMLLFQNNLNFSMVVTMITLFKHVTFCHLMKTIMNLFFSFAQILGKISLQITAESASTFYQNFNTIKISTPLF